MNPNASAKPASAPPPDQWLAMGVSKTVYSLPLPQHRAAIRACLSKVDELMERHERPWERRQDGMHEGYRRAWLGFAAKAGLGLGAESAWSFYPTAGASEALRETLALMRAQGAGLVVFEGEYEGYEAVAKALGMDVLHVRRGRWREDLPAAWAKGFELFVSNPSSLDGMHWRDFDACCALADERGGSVHLDAAYVGACALPAPIDAARECVKSVFFSLSKPFGAYYRRVGGCLSRKPNALLEGNKWFKSLDALAVGEALLRWGDPGAAQRAWEPERERVIAELSERHGWTLRASDVFMLARGEGPMMEHLARATGMPGSVCISPALGDAIQARELEAKRDGHV